MKARPTASAELSRRVGEDDLQVESPTRRCSRPAAFENLPGKWQAPLVHAARRFPYSFDDAQVSFCCVAKHTQGVLVFPTLVSGDCLSDAVELNQDGALLDPGFENVRGLTTGKEPAPELPHHRAGELRIFGDPFWIADRAKHVHPVRLGHRSMIVPLGACA